jgi:hypothetical protein
LVVPRRFGVLAAIHLNDQTPVKAYEIGDKSSQRMLTAEPKTRDLFISEVSPENSLRVGGVLS